MQPQPMWFGLAGGDQWVPDGDGRTGQVNRVVELGVQYQPPPDAAGLRPWQLAGRDGSGRARWSMPGLPAAAGEIRNLYALAERLRPRRGRVPPDDADLEELDWVVRSLLAAVRQLHAAGRSVGLIHPLNVFWYAVRVPNKPPRRVLVLPDVGFTAADGSAEVRWLWSAAEVEQRRLRPATQEQERELAFRRGWYPDPRAIHRKFDPKQEAAAVARVLDWVVSGRIRTTVPPPAADPLSRLPVYGILAGAVAGNLPGVSALAQTILPGKSNRIAQAFLRPPDEPPGRPRPWIKWLAALLVLVIIPVGGWVAFDHVRWVSNEPPPNPLYPDLPPGSKVRPHLDRLKDLLDRKTNPPDDPDELLRWLGDMTREVREAGEDQAAAPAEDPADRDKELACLAVIRGRVRDQYDDHLSRFRDIKRVRDAAFGTEAGNRVIKTWSTRALDQTRQTRELLPTIPEEQPWRPTWTESIEAMGRAAALR